MVVSNRPLVILWGTYIHIGLISGRPCDEARVSRSYPPPLSCAMVSEPSPPWFSGIGVPATMGEHLLKLPESYPDQMTQGGNGLVRLGLEGGQGVTRPILVSQGGTF